MTEAPTPAPIRTLSGVLANQIAAGEVVERPASVVKELVENALDAAATAIDIELEAGGAGLIRVRDNGFGISAGELVLALSRHATSKIATLDDLDRIASMGFRGEALPSIASVSRLVLASRPADAESGHRVSVDGGRVGAVEPAASKPGTTVEVRDLFFNVPARRKFLRTPRTELRHAEDAVRRLALARPDVSFTLHHDARKALEVSRRMDPVRRLARLVGNEFAASALELSFEVGDLSMHGFLAPPTGARTRSDLQFLFVNGRSVRDDVVRHAVRVGFGDTLGSAAYPAFVLHLVIEPAAVDVNVHPTKHEVRFREHRHVHDFVRHAVARTLGGYASDVPPETAALTLESGSPSPGAAARTPRAPTPTLYPTSGPRPGASRVADHLAAYATLSSGSRPAQAGAARGRVRLGAYVLVEDGEKLLLIELGAGRGALVRDRLGELGQTRTPVSRPLLIPHPGPVPEAIADAVDAARAALQSLGIEIRRSAPGALTLRAIPACLAGIAPDKLLDAVGDWAKTSDMSDPVKASDPVAALVDVLGRLAGSSPTDGDIDDIIDAAIGGRLATAVIDIDEATLRRIFTAAPRR